jgi:hypothetical protein
MTRFRSLRDSQRVLHRSATLVSLGVFGLGAGLFLDQVRPLVSDAQFTWGERRVMAIVGVTTLGGFGLAGWLAGRLLRVAGDLIEVFVESAEAATHTNALIETHLAPTLSRAAVALERIAAGAAAGVRDPAADLGVRLEAALAAEDPDRVIACRDALTQHLRGEALRDLDRRVVRWLFDRIQKQVNSGQATPELAALVARVADSFGDTPEGASLHDALPGLRRRAGLCPRCARPNRTNADVCPDCRAEDAARLRPRSGEATSKGQR